MLMRARAQAPALAAITCRRCPPRLDGKQCIDPRHVCGICAGIGIRLDINQLQYIACTHPGVAAADVATLPRRDKHVPDGIWDKKTVKKKRKAKVTPVAKDKKKADETDPEISETEIDSPEFKAARKAAKAKKKAKKKAKAAKRQLEAAEPLDLDELEPDDDPDQAASPTVAERDDAEPAEPADPDADEPDEAVDADPEEEADSDEDVPYGDDADADEPDYNPDDLTEIVSSQDMTWENFLKHLQGRHSEMHSKLKQPAVKLSKAAQSSTRALHYRMHNARIMDEGMEHVHVPHDND